MTRYRISHLRLYLSEYPHFVWSSCPQSRDSSSTLPSVPQAGFPASQSLLVLLPAHHEL